MEDMEKQNKDGSGSLGSSANIPKSTPSDQAPISGAGAPTDMELQIMEQVIDLAVDNLLDEFRGRVVEDIIYINEIPNEKGSHTNDVVADNEDVKGFVHPTVDIDSYGDRDGTEVVMQGSNIAGEILRHQQLIRSV